MLTVPASSSAADKICSPVELKTSNGNIYAGAYYMLVHQTTCGTGRKVARRFLNVSEGADKIPVIDGFRCKSVHQGRDVACRRGSQRVTWSKEMGE